MEQQLNPFVIASLMRGYEAQMQISLTPANDGVLAVLMMFRHGVPDLALLLGARALTTAECVKVPA